MSHSDYNYCYDFWPSRILKGFWSKHKLQRGHNNKFYVVLFANALQFSLVPCKEIWVQYTFHIYSSVNAYWVALFRLPIQVKIYPAASSSCKNKFAFQVDERKERGRKEEIKGTDNKCQWSNGSAFKTVKLFINATIFLCHFFSDPKFIIGLDVLICIHMNGTPLGFKNNWTTSSSSSSTNSNPQNIYRVVTVFILCFQLLHNAK